jgi:acyl-CoA synthetase (AMP-forming)/AMP-acid ligase II
MLLSALTSRPTCVYLPQFTASAFADLIEEGRVGTVFVLPTMAAELLDSGALTGRDTSAVRMVGSPSPLPVEMAERLATAFPNATIVDYEASASLGLAW